MSDPFAGRSEITAEEYISWLSSRRQTGLIIPPAEETVPDWMTQEKAFMAKVAAFASEHGWRTYHTWKSANSAPGFPDLVALRGLRLVIVELKVGDNKPTKDQQWWLDGLRALGIGPVEVHLWFPDDWEAIEVVLR